MITHEISDKKYRVIGIIGSRRRDSYQDYLLVENKFLEISEQDDIICSGRATRGGDRFAEKLALKYKRNILLFPAQWDRFGKSAGFIRNIDIAMCSDVIIACVSEDRTGGTEHTIKEFIKYKNYDCLFLV